jgi:hypothetical protein
MKKITNKEEIEALKIEINSQIDEAFENGLFIRAGGIITSSEENYKMEIKIEIKNKDTLTGFKKNK